MTEQRGTLRGEWHDTDTGCPVFRYRLILHPGFIGSYRKDDPEDAKAALWASHAHPRAEDYHPDFQPFGLACVCSIPACGCSGLEHP